MSEAVVGPNTPPPLNRGTWSGARAVVGMFIFFNGLSLFYSLVTGEYNGDFYGVPVGLPHWALLAVFLLTTLPFLVLRWLGRHFDQRPPALLIDCPLGFLRVFVPVTLVLQAFVTWRFGVGIIGQDPYEVGGLMKFVVLFLNRFQPFYLGAFLVVLLPKRSRLELLIFVLMVLVGVLRAGIGVFLYILIILILKYVDEIKPFLRRHKVSAIVALCVTPFLISALYTARNTWRDTEAVEDQTVAMIAAGLFTGRMSALTNTAVVIENADHFRVAAKDLAPGYYYRQALSTFLGAGFGPTPTPQQLLINMDGGGIDNITYMTGPIGELVIAGQSSLAMGAGNLAMALSLIVATLWLARQFRSPAIVRLALGLLCYPVMSGVPTEISAVLYFFVVMAMLLCVVNVFVPKSPSPQ